MNRGAAVFLLALGVACGACMGDPAVISLNSFSPVAQDFDAMGSGSTATLPMGWQLSNGSDFGGGGSSTQFSAGTRGGSAIYSASHGGFFKFWGGVNSSGHECAVGGFF